MHHKATVSSDSEVHCAGDSIHESVFQASCRVARADSWEARPEGAAERLLYDTPGTSGKEMART